MSRLAPRRPPLVAGGSASRTPEARALRLVELVSRAAAEPDVWRDFTAALSAELGDAAVLLMLEPPSREGPCPAYLANVDASPCLELAALFVAGEMPWPLDPASTERFVDLGEGAEDVDVEPTRYYRTFLEPQGLAPRSPLAFTFASTASGSPLGGIVIHERVGGRRLDGDDLAFLDLLAPHLRQAYRVHAALVGTASRREAYEEVLDRFPTGVVLIDADRTVVVSNRAARRIASLDDGFSLANGRARASDAASNIALQRVIREVLDHERERSLGYDEGFTLRRPSGKRDFAVMVSSVLASPEVGALPHVAAAIYISDPERRQLGMRALLGSFHKLTDTEIELAAMICEGETLEAVARARGISLHTARSHLKRIFLKTDTRRQADLVGLVQAGLTNLQGPDDRDDPDDDASVA